MRIYQLVDTYNDVTLGYFDDPAVAVESLRISYSAFTELTVKQQLIDIIVDYTAMSNSRIQLRFLLVPCELIKSPRHL